MSSRAEALLGIGVVLAALVLVGLLVAPTESEQPRPALRMCAHPDDLPWSDSVGNGYVNRLAQLFAAELGRDLEYHWIPRQSGAASAIDTLSTMSCDIAPAARGGVASGWPVVPYQRSTWVFVHRANGPAIVNMDDPTLRDLRIRVAVPDHGRARSPVVAALGKRGIVDDANGYGAGGVPSPSRLIEAVATGEIDVAVVRGPVAAYLAPLQDVELAVAPVSPGIDPPFMPFAIDLALAVRPGADSLRAALADVARTRAADIRTILEEHGVPLLDGLPAPTHADPMRVLRHQ